MHEDVMPGARDEEPGDAVWVRSVDYLDGWREARDAAAEWNAALASVGVAGEDLRAVASTGAQGEGVVRLRGTPVGMRRAAWLLRLGAGTVSARKACG